jgi:hypothetical protein
MMTLLHGWTRRLAALGLMLAAGTAFAVDPEYMPDNALGVDARVDYTLLLKYGPWDDQNYQLRLEDVQVLPPNDVYRPGVPAFFKIQKRREMAAEGFPLQEHYPRELNKEFQIRYGGLTQGGVLHREGLGKYYHPDPKQPRQPQLLATDPLPKAAPLVFEGAFDGTLSNNETSIEYHPTNPLIAVAGSNGSGGQRMSFTSNGGLTWGNSGALPNTCCDPAMDWSPDGSIAFSATLGTGGGCGFSLCTQVYWSFNNGQNWSGPVNLSTASSDKEFIHVDKSPTSPFFGRAYVTWHQGNVMQFARSTAMPVQSPASPMTFAAPISFSAEERGIGSDITTDRQGRIYYFWPTTTNGSTEIRVLRSDDGGVTFVDLNGAATGLSNIVYDLHGDFDMAIPAMESRRAFIYAAADVDVSGGPRDGRIYVAFTDENAAAGSPGGGSGSAAATHAWIQVAYSDDQGATWSVAATPHSTADQTTVDRFQPWLDVDQLGNVHIGWQDTRNSGAGLRNKADWYYAASQDGGTTWIEETRVSSVVSQNINNGQEWGDYNGVSVAAGSAQVGMTWTDNRIVTPPSTTSQRSFVGIVQNVVACEAPGTPTIGTATATGPNQIQTTWSNGTPPSAKFNVYRATGTCAAPGAFTLVGNGVAGSPFNDTSVSGGTTYAYRVAGTEATGVCESEDSACVQATATGACTLSPTFAGITSAASATDGQCAVELGWSAATAQCGGPMTFNVYRSTTSGFTPSPANRIATGVTGTTYIDTDALVNGTPYFYVVRAVDGGNSVEEGNTTQLSATPLGALTVANIVDTFEAPSGFDTPGWTHAALNGANDWAWSTAQSQTPTHSWFSDSLPSTADRVLTSPSFGATATSTLSFFHTFDFEIGSSGSCFDAGTLEVSTNGGTTWTVMPDANFTAGGFNGTVATGTNPLAGKRAWCGGTIGPMTQVNVNLGSFAAQSIRLRWHEGNDVSVEDTGWFVDSVTITNAGTAGVCSNGPPINLFANGFE